MLSISPAAMPVVPKLAWRMISFGGAARSRLVNAGAAHTPAAASAARRRNLRRVSEVGMVELREAFNGQVAEHDRVVVAGQTEVAALAILAGMRFAVQEFRHLAQVAIKDDSAV